jgi:integrase
MPRYTKRQFRLGEWFLWRRGDSPAYYRARFNRATGKFERVSLGTDRFEEAKSFLEQWWLQTRAVTRETAASASLADILRRYYETHAQHLPSASGNRDALNKWLDYWQEASVADLSVERQEGFLTHMQKLGLKASTIQRTLNIGKAAISRAFKRGELAAMPLVLSVAVKMHPPKGRPLEIAELSRLYQSSAPHLRTFIRWMLGTAARPDALLNLCAEQVEWAHGIIRLNPEGREQNKKHRPVVRLPATLAGEVFEGWLVTHKGRVRTASGPPGAQPSAAPNWPARSALTPCATPPRAGCACAASRPMRLRSNSATASWASRGFTPSTTRSTSRRPVRPSIVSCKPYFPKTTQLVETITGKRLRNQGLAAVAQW